MNQYNFHGSSSLQQNRVDQPLTPISDLTTHHYHKDSLSQPPVLPPLHAQGNSQASQYAFNYKQNGSLPPTPQDMSAPHTPSHMEHHHLPHPAPYPSFNPTYSAGDAQSSYAVSNNYTAAPASHGYTSSAQFPGRVVSAPTSQYAQNSFIDYRTSGIVGYPYQQYAQPEAPPHPLHHHQQQQQQQQQQSPDTPTHEHEERPVPVVGSQGRRGILPSHVGPPAPGSTPDGTPRGGGIPNKNADNKYPCLYCNKTYLHLKHLKRHHLRRK